MKKVTKPSLSIVVPVYNTEKYLRRCMDSIMNQTLKDIEIIIVDDGSKKECAVLCDEISKTDSRIKVIHQENRGLSETRNRGMELATGEYICFIDSDDYIALDFYESLINTIGDYDFIQFGYKRVTTNGKVICQKLPHHIYQFHSACMRIYRKDFLAKNNLLFMVGKLYEDVLFSIDLWRARPTYQIIPYTGYYYSIRSASTTATRNRNAEKELFITLKQKLQQTQTIWFKLLILTTIIRLKFHFKRYDYPRTPSITPL